MTKLDEALDVLGGLVLEDGETRWAEAATEAQWEDARRVLDPQSEQPYHFLLRARGYSKSSDLAAHTLAAQLTQLPPHSRGYGIASDRDQADLLRQAAEGFIRRTPALRNAFEVNAWRIATKRTNVVLEILAADGPGAWGLRPEWLILDEVCQWADTPSARGLFEAITTAAAKRPTCRMTLLSTAGSPSHWSYRVYEHALKDPLWHVHSIPGPPPWMSKERIDEQRRRLPESSFARLFLNEWCENEDMLTTADSLARCIVLAGPLEPVSGRSYVCGLDLGVVSDRSVATICHAERVRGHDGEERTKVVMDRQQVWAGSRRSPVRLEDVEGWLYEASRMYRPLKIIYDPFQAVQMSQRLRARGLTLEQFNFTPASVSKIAVALHTLIREGLISIPDDDELVDELLGLRLIERSPGTYRLEHDASRHDDRAVSLALAAHHLVKRRPFPLENARIISLVQPNPFASDLDPYPFHDTW